MAVAGDSGTLPFRLNCNPLFQIIAEESPVLFQSKGAKDLVSIIDSTAFANVTVASLKNIRYTFLSEQTGADTFDHAVTARLRYLETGLMSVASLVHNVVFAMVFTAVAIVTFGQVQTINNLFTREWMHAALSFGSVVASSAGTIVPKLGQLVNLRIAYFAVAAVIGASERDCIGAIKAIYRRNKERFSAVGLELVQKNCEIFNRAFQPILNYIDSNLDGVRTYRDLVRFSKGVAGATPAEASEILRNCLSPAEPEPPEGATV